MDVRPMHDRELDEAIETYEGRLTAGRTMMAARLRDCADRIESEGKGFPPGVIRAVSGLLANLNLDTVADDWAVLEGLKAARQARAATRDANRDMIEKLTAARDDAEANQLATYVKNVAFDKLTDEERGYPATPSDAHSLIGYEKAYELPIERLRELFEADDWGDAWELMDGESTEYFEQDAGRIQAYDAALALLKGEETTDGNDA